MEEMKSALPSQRETETDIVIQARQEEIRTALSQVGKIRGPGLTGSLGQLNRSRCKQLRT